MGNGSMDKRQIGSTGVSVSALGLGTVKFGRNEGVKYPSSYELPADSDLQRLLVHAQELGVTTLDTAPAYGTSEERIGNLLKGRRHEWTIIGKAGEEFENGRSRYIFTADHFVKSLERTLKRLQTDHLDVLLIHSDGSDLRILSDDRLIAKMQDFKRTGMVRAIGASTKTAAGGLRALEIMDVVMATYTEDYTDEKSVLDQAALTGKSILLKKVLGSGHNKDIDQAMNFAFSHPGVDSVIIGTINPNHLRQNAEAAIKAFAARSS
jgi:aryl-alcohol dehydrogenase-like predicted oxidoreductase